MDAKVHLRDMTTITMSVCGSGYIWPSTILLSTTIEPVTCAICRRLFEKNGDL